jgi:hypothetical protein
VRAADVDAGASQGCEPYDAADEGLRTTGVTPEGAAALWAGGPPVAWSRLPLVAVGAADIATDVAVA